MVRRNSHSPARRQALLVKYLSANSVARIVLSIGIASIIGLALYPNLKLPNFAPSGEHTDLFYHMIAFLLLTVSATITLERDLLVMTLMAGFAIALELLQAFVPGRRVFFTDAIASLLGVLLGTLLMLVATKFRRRWRRMPQHQ